MVAFGRLLSISRQGIKPLLVFFKHKNKIMTIYRVITPRCSFIVEDLKRAKYYKSYLGYPYYAIKKYNL